MAHEAARVPHHSGAVNFALPSPGLTEAPSHQLWSLQPEVSNTEALGESRRNCGVECGDVICFNISVGIDYAFGQLFPA